MALKLSHKLAGNLLVPDAYFRVSAYRVNLDDGTVAVLLQMFANKATRDAFKKATTAIGEIPAKRAEAKKAADAIQASEVRAKSDATLAVMQLDAALVAADDEQKKNQPVVETEVVIPADKVAAIIGKDRQIKIGDIYAALKAGEFAGSGAEDV